MEVYEGWSDAELVAKSLEGEKFAFSTLHARYKSQLLSYGFKQMGNQYDAEVLVQESFTKALACLGDLREASKFANWIFRIASRVSVDMHRERRKRRENMSLSSISGESNLLQNAAILSGRKAEQQSTRRGLEDRLRIAVADLPDSERLPLQMWLDGVSYKGIALALEITVAAVKQRLVRGRTKVMNTMLEFERESDDFIP